ncbi:formyltransferase family protein [Nitrosopumilus sp.]|uniref:formyltransferase family protein n=1 Tax=Nitrosopumilus sp. TaxID=2024843 RepID=UPI003D0AC826
MKLGIILTEDNRSKAYLQKILAKNIHLDEIIFMNESKNEEILDEIISQGKKYGFDISEKIIETLQKNNLQFKEFPFVDINNQELVNYLKKLDLDYMIFTGGGILKEEILNCKLKFIHLHPGIVPDYKGSTCFYYSILDRNVCGVSGIILNKGLDTGDIIYQRKFEKPSHSFVDEIYDPHIRSETLIDILKKNDLKNHKYKKQIPTEGTTYYIIHPVLKHIAILSCQKNI